MKRHLSPLIDELLEQFPCVALVGVRQSGKTTLHQLPRRWRHFDMDKGSDRALVDADPDLFFRLNPLAITIDEAQLVPELFPALRVAIDADRQTMGHLVITGSSSPALRVAISESLAGRVALIELSPLSLAEALEEPPSEFFSSISAKAPAESFLIPELSVEKACDRFAGAFLAPRAMVRSELGVHRSRLEPRELHSLKHASGLSMGAWIHRAREAGVISTSTARALARDFRQRGWDKREPGAQVPPEFERLVVRALAEELISSSKAAELLAIPTSELRARLCLDDPAADRGADR